MKAIKTFGLAVLAALMAMVFVGASSAMAEEAQLCGHNTAPCEAVHHIHLVSVGNAKLLTSIGTTECEELFLGDVLKWGNPTIISGTLTLSNCKLGGASCTETEENGPVELKVEKEGHETAKVTGEYLVHLVCGKAIDCSYTGTGLVGVGKGPALSAESSPNGEITISEATLTKEVGGLLCPKTAKLDITLEPLPKSPIYYTTGLLGYCVETEHTNGVFEDSKCEKLGGTVAEHKYKYALIFAPVGGKVEDPVCYGTLLPYGLWKKRNAFSGICEEDDLKNESLYEKGVVKLVE